MNVWLLHIGEELPVDGPSRSFRYGYLAEALRAAGHEVLRWAPTFRHAVKQHRFTADCRVEVAERYDIQFVHSPGYPRNTSMRRLSTYRFLGRRFRELASHQILPNLIISAIPSLEWAEAAVDLGRQFGVPVVVDVRDLWPDVFPSALPPWARAAGRIFMTPYRRMARRACRGATSLVAVSASYLDWALAHAGRMRSARDYVLPLGFEPAACSTDALHAARVQLYRRGIDPTRPVCFFAGGLERHHDVETVIDAARRLAGTGRRDPQFIICGSGSKAAALQERARDLPNMHFLGWVDATMLQAVASISAIGLCAYAKGTMVSLGNKPFEYMAGRLAIVSSLPGELSRLLAEHDCGLTYRAGDADSLAHCLQELLGNSMRLELLQNNGRNAWSRMYRSSEIYSRFVEHVTTLTAAQALAA